MVCARRSPRVWRISKCSTCSSPNASNRSFLRFLDAILLHTPGGAEIARKISQRKANDFNPVIFFIACTLIKDTPHVSLRRRSGSPTKSSLSLMCGPYPCVARSLKMRWCRLGGAAALSHHFAPFLSPRVFAMSSRSFCS